MNLMLKKGAPEARQTKEANTGLQKMQMDTAAEFSKIFWSQQPRTVKTPTPSTTNVHDSLYA